MSQLISIDMQIGMKYAGNSEVLYKKMIDRFYSSYINIDMNNMDSDEFKRAIHNLKTISMSIGAVNLHYIAKEIDESGCNDKLPQLIEEMITVLNDVKKLLEQ